MSSGVNIWPLEYKEARRYLNTGDLVLFPRLVLADVVNAPAGRRLATLGGWFSNLLISSAQRMTGYEDRRDGLWQFPHVGVVYRKPEDLDKRTFRLGTDEVLLLESLSSLDADGKTGPRLVRLRERVAAYPHALLVVPLRLPIDEDVADSVDVFNLVEEARSQRYDYPGLVGALTGWGIGSPEALFCSELVATLLQRAGVLADTRRLARKNGRWHLVTADRLPSAVKPSQCARLECYDLNRAYFITGRQT